MLDVGKMLLHGGLLSVLASAYILAVLYVNPRLVLQNYREDIRSRVPEKDEREKRITLLIGVPFMLLVFLVPFLSTMALKTQFGESEFLALALHAFGVSFIFNLVDLLILDWFMFCLWTPRFIMLPGTEDMGQAYKDAIYHLKKAGNGTLISIIAGLAIGLIVWLI